MTHPVYKNLRNARAAGFVLILLLLFFTRRAHAETAVSSESVPNITIDPAHDPFYQEPFQKLYAIAQQTVPQAYRQIARQWGLNAQQGLSHPLTVEITEDSSEHLQRRPAYTQAEGVGDHFHQRLVMDLGTYLEHPQEDIQKMLHHEMAHVILNDAVSGKMVPRWFHEGLAQSVTSEGHQTVQKAFAYWKWSDGRLSEVGLCDLNGAIDEFAHGPDNGYCYPEYYLAVQRFRQLGGPKALLLAIDDINAGRSFNEILPAVTGLDAATFQADVERYANEIFNNRRPIP